MKIATLDGEHLGMLSELMLYSWPSTKTEVQKELQPYLLFRDEIAIIDRIAMKGKRIIVLAALQDKAVTS